MEAQFQIRQNAIEAQDYMQDLLSWQQKVKQKSSNAKHDTSAEAGVPGVRGRTTGSVGAAPSHMQQPVVPISSAQAAAPRTSSPAAHTYKNYSKWDKFDVDAALADEQAASSPPKQQPTLGPAGEVQQPQQLVARSNSSSATPRVAQPSPPTAASLKDRGNKLYQAGYYSDAIECYTQSIQQQPNSIAYANRAMAELKLNRYAEAEQDCTAALQLDPTYVKALHRRGTARKQLNKLLEAATDFEEALRLEPANKTLQSDRDDALQQHLQQNKIPASNIWSSIPIKQQAVVDVTPRQQQQQQHRESAETASTAGLASEATVSQPVSSLANGTSSAAAVPAAAPAQTAAAVKPAGSTSPASAASAAAVAPGVPTSNGIAPPKAAASPAAAAVSSPARSPSPQGMSTTAAAAQAAAAQLAARLAAGLKAPRTSNEFEAAWRSFRGDQGLQAKYLKLIQPQQLLAVFKASLTAPILTALLTVALNAVAQAGTESSDGALDASHAVGLIEQMVKVPRFDMTAMCLTSRDKAALKQLWDTGEECSDAGLSSRLQSVRAKYRL